MVVSRVYHGHDRVAQRRAEGSTCGRKACTRKVSEPCESYLLLPWASLVWMAKIDTQIHRQIHRCGWMDGWMDRRKQSSLRKTRVEC